MRPARALSALSLAALLIAAGRPARADDEAAAVKEKLFQAKKDYDAEMQKFRKAVGDLLDKREDDARKAGSKKAVDAAKAERKAFDDTGELPPMLPAAVKQQVTAARTKLDKAFAAAVKEYVKLKEDAAAEAAEKEQRKFALDAALLFGKRTSLVTLKPFDIKVEQRGYFVNDETRKMGLETVPHCVYMHTPARGDSEASYPLGGKWVGLRVAVGVPKPDDKTAVLATPLTFEVLGDGKSLWKSEPVAGFDAFQTAVLRVEKVKTLTLRVNCPGHNGWAQSVWFAPVLVE